jgi:predicted anti-sigma-YlaC factor YlaD
MQCDHARILMDQRLDGGAAPGLLEHLAVCASCAREWSELQTADHFLLAQEMVEPPAHLTSRVMNNIEVKTGSLPSWRQTLLQVALLLVGTLLVLTATAAFFHGWWQVLASPDAASQVDGVVRGAGLVTGMLFEVVGHSAIVWPMYAALVVAMALVWFGALVVPRSAPRMTR